MMETTTTKVYETIYKVPKKNSYTGFVSSVIVHAIILLLLLWKQEVAAPTQSLSVTLLEEKKPALQEEKKEKEKTPRPKAPKEKKKPDLLSALKEMKKPPPMPKMPTLPQEMKTPKIEMANLPKEPNPVLPIKGIEIKETTKDIGPQAQIDISSLENEEGAIGGEIVVGKGVATSEIMKKAVYQPSISVEATTEGEGGLPSTALPGGGGSSGGQGINLGVQVPESEPPPTSGVSTPVVKGTGVSTKKKKKVTVEISGSIAGRKILSQVMPSFPSWAAEQGLQAVVTVRVYVTPEGKVKSNVIVMNTSGYPAWDNAVKRSVLLWKFASLPPGTSTIQSGYITFHFILE